MPISPSSSARTPHAKRARSFLTVLALGLLGTWGSLATGCNHTLPPDPMAEAAGSGERPVAMKGDASYFDRKVAATVTISRGFSRDLSGLGPKGEKQRPGRRGRREGNDATTVGINDSLPGSSGDTETEQREAYEDMVRLIRAQRAAGSPMPPVTIRLKLENLGTEPVEVDLLEVNSELGNFAVRPAKLTLAPGQTGESDPMISQLGVTSDEIPIKVALRTAGKKETQVIPVKNLFIGLEKKD
jgi:hypothetical protein